MAIYNADASITGIATVNATVGIIYQGGSVITANAGLTINAANKLLTASIIASTSISAKSLKAIYTSLANNKVKFFVMNDKCYILDGTNYLVFDGITISKVEDNAYVPTIALSMTPAGSGTPNEAINLLTPAFINSFSGDGTTVAYQLSAKVLDATAVIASIDGGVTYSQVEGTNFTVNRTTGVVTWTTAPATGTNNVKIKAYKTVAGNTDKIRKCTLVTLFGGANDTRVFLASGNIIYRSGLYDPTYFPDDGSIKIGSDAGNIMGFAKQYDTCTIFKESTPNDSPVWNMNYNLDTSTGKVTFPIKPVNDVYGCIASGSIQIIGNNPVWLSNDGVYNLTSTTVRDERNASRISMRVDPKLLQELNLKDAISADYDYEYWLAVNGKVYLFDYRTEEWYPFDNMPISCFLIKDNELYFGSNTQGLIYKFNKKTDTYPYNDDGQAINAYWYSAMNAFGSDETKKLVDRIFFSLAPYYKASADVYYISDKKQSDLLKTKRIDLFSFPYFDFNTLSFLTSYLPQEAMIKVKAKKIIYFQLKLQNNRLNEFMGLYSIAFLYRYQSYVR